jgi:hypothetical protein
VGADVDEGRQFAGAPVETAILLLLTFVRDANAVLRHLPPPSVTGQYSRLCWTWDSCGWWWYYADQAHHRAYLMDRLHYAEQARRCVTPAQWVSQEWPVPAYWRAEP